MNEQEASAMLGDILARLKRVESIAGSTPIRSKQEREDATMVKAALARMKRIDERMDEIESKRDTANRKFVEQVAMQAVGKALPNFFLSAAEPIVDQLVGIEGKMAEVPAQIDQATSTVRASAGASALAAKNAAQSIADASKDFILGRANTFAFGAPMKGDFE